MALNVTMLDDKRKPIPLPGEIILKSYESGAELVLDIPKDRDGPPHRSKAIGAVLLTEQRVRRLAKDTRLHFTTGYSHFVQQFVFISTPNSQFDSLTVPLPAILSTHFEQPTFSANYFAFEIKPTGVNGGLQVGTQVELRFKSTPMFEFVALLEKTRERAIYMKRQKDQEDNELRELD